MRAPASVEQFRPKMVVRYESEDFIIKSAETLDEFIGVLRLRHEIFIREWQGREAPTGLDLEPFDLIGDHLIVIDKRKPAIVGTYRLLCSQFCTRFYSQDEFEMASFIDSSEIKLEMGRACIHQEYRNGAAIDLLWKGLARYISSSGARYLFGCTSVKSTAPEHISALLLDLKSKEQWSDEFRIRATPKYQYEAMPLTHTTPIDRPALRELVPPLLRSYLHAGAKVYGQPALDRDFSCVDFLTILDMERLNNRFRSRFF